MIQAYILLAISIVFEVFATSLLPATKGFTVWKPSVLALVCYIICFAAFGKCAISNPLQSGRHLKRFQR